MAIFQAQGIVHQVTPRGKGNVVSLKEKDDRPPLDIYAFGTPPAVGQEVICVGYINGREYNGRVYPDISGTFATVIHSTAPGDCRPMPPRPQQNTPAQPAKQVDDEDIPF